MAFNLSYIVNKLLPAQIKGSDVAVPVDVQFANVQAAIQTLTVNITGTGSNWILTNADWSHYKQVTMRITNTHDQPVTIQFNRQDNGAMVYYNPSSPNNGIAVTIPAGAANMMVTPHDLPILGYASFAEQIALNATCTAAPTTGTLTVALYFTPLGA